MYARLKIRLPLPLATPAIASAHLRQIDPINAFYCIRRSKADPGHT
jgi:hypothetical protein